MGVTDLREHEAELREKLTKLADENLHEVGALACLSALSSPAVQLLTMARICRSFFGAESGIGCMVGDGAGDRHA